MVHFRGGNMGQFLPFDGAPPRVPAGAEGLMDGALKSTSPRGIGRTADARGRVHR
ncbi:hypothetical protein STRIP9103_07613 [Streptomyces ipomoeae 91-03]|uniref:Uncharacterized protein n=1 Tax=Streptomyces ipomoeae 91-03 TaxID=698759 RepID=L1KU01_9ACTN|nr:hypothetical protein STRIP9103_07613 [Streptomyces ipomoeae 91-03]